MDFDFNKVLRFAFVDWFKQKGILKYVAFLFLFYFLTTIISNYAMFALFSPLDNLALMSAPESMGMIVYFIFFIAAMILFSIIVGSIVSFFVIAKALDSKKMNFAEFSVEKWLKLIGLMIMQSLSILFSIFKLRLLLIPISAIILTGLGLILIILSSSGATIFALVGILFVIIAILLSLVYLAVMIYNSIRLALSSAIFVEGEKSIMNSLKYSWEVSRGSAVNIFVVFLMVGVAVGVISSIVSIPLTVYTAGMYPVSEGATSVTFTESMGQLLNPIVILLTIPSILVQSIFVIIQAFAVIGIYSELKNRGKTKEVTKPSLAAKKVAKKKANVKSKRK